MYEQYHGHVDVFAFDEDEAYEAAYRKLKSTSFPDRNKSMWKFYKIEYLKN